MRIDKFLKVSRLIKRRTVAKEVADKGRIQINGRIAKAGSEVRVNDVLTIELGNKIIKCRIKDIREQVRANEASCLYEIIE